MTFSASVRALLLLATLAVSGCVPTAQSQLDEEKEPHFLAGKNRVSTMDYQGAIECFDKALEVNPQSAAAHFELACLFDQKEANPADAIYHYEHFLKLRPNAGNAEVIKQRILACKQALAQTVFLPNSEKAQRDFEQLLEENKRLTEENKRLHDELDKPRATGGPQATPAPVRTAAPPAQPTTAGRTPTLVMVNTGNTSRTGAANTGTTTRPPVSTTAPTRTHTVKQGETPILIARHYGVKLDVLLAANPRLDPRKMRVGQSLSIPVQ
jgi:tetratricopeptide (TPR) repeat protein